MPSETQQAQAARELLEAATAMLRTTRRVIALLNLPVDERAFCELDNLSDARDELVAAVTTRFDGEDLEEPATPERYRFSAGH